jgi:hypothetical protein
LIDKARFQSGLFLRHVFRRQQCLVILSDTVDKRKKRDEILHHICLQVSSRFIALTVSLTTPYE